MSFADRVKDVTTSTGTGAFTLSGTPPAGGYQPISAIGGTGTTFIYGATSGNLWEIGVGTITGANTVSRAPSSSSSGGSLVSFPAGAEFFCTLSAAQIAKFNSTNAVAFATAIALTTPGTAYMTPQAVTADITFTLAANPVQGALVYTALTADGVVGRVITMPAGFKEWGGSMGYDNRAGIKNQLQFSYDGSDYWYMWSQAVGAVAVDTIAPTASSAAVANATPTFVDITFSEPMNQAFTPPVGTVVAATHTTTALAWLSATVLRATQSAAFVNGEARSLTITPNGTNNLRDLAGNQITTTQTIATITNNVGAVATGATLSGPSGGAVSVASSAITLAITPVGSNVTGTVRYTFADGGAGGSFNPAFLDLSNGTPSGTTQYTPSAVAGARTLTTTNNGSGMSNPTLTYTSTAASSDTLVTLTNLANGLAMGATGEYSGGGAAYTAATAGHGQAGTLKIPSGQAGRVSFDWTTANNCLLILDETVGTVDHNNALFALWMYVPATLVQYSTNAGSGSGSVNYKTPAAGLRYSINKTAGGTVTVEESVDSGANWSVIYTFGTTWATGDLYPAWVGAVVHQPRASGLV